MGLSLAACNRAPSKDEANKALHAWLSDSSETQNVFIKNAEPLADRLCDDKLGAKSMADWKGKVTDLRVTSIGNSETASAQGLGGMYDYTVWSVWTEVSLSCTLIDYDGKRKGPSRSVSIDKKFYLDKNYGGGKNWHVDTEPYIPH
jgi:hypothetical protein